MAHISGTTGSRNFSFTIPAGAGAYDTSNILQIRKKALPAGDNNQYSDVLEIVIAVHTLPTSASVELEVLKPGLDPTSDSNWFVASSITATGHGSPITLFASGVRIRGKSGGTGGACNISAFWYY